MNESGQFFNAAARMGACVLCAACQGKITWSCLSCIVLDCAGHFWGMRYSRGSGGDEWCRNQRHRNQLEKEKAVILFGGPGPRLQFLNGVLHFQRIKRRGTVEGHL